MQERFRLLKSETYGFTLMEILVVVTLFALLATIGSGLFITIMRGSNKANVLNEIKQNGDYVLGIIERSIRNADEVDTASGVNCSASGSLNNFLQLKGFDYDTIRFYKNGDALYQEKTIPPSPPEITSLTNTLVALNGDPNFICYTVSNTDLRADRIKISFTLRQAGDPNLPIDQTASMLFETTVSLRNK